jgi:predicted metal-dependent peptidase
MVRTDGTDGTDGSSDGSDGDTDGSDSTDGTDGTDGSSDGPDGSDGTPDPGGCGAVEDADEEEGDLQDQEAEWRSNVSLAISAAEKAGTVPGSLKTAVETIMNPPMPWHVLLRDYLDHTARNDYAWDTPDQTYIQEDIYVPGIVSDELPEVIVLIDSSASTRRYLSHFCTEASNVLAAFSKATIRVIYCDYVVQSEEVYESSDLPIKMEPCGGGGTSFVTAFEYVQNKGYNPACVIYFTDLCGAFPDKEPDMPVLWVTYGTDTKAPFGVTIPMDEASIWKSDPF